MMINHAQLPPNTLQMHLNTSTKHLQWKKSLKICFLKNRNFAFLSGPEFRQTSNLPRGVSLLACMQLMHYNHRFWAPFSFTFWFRPKGRTGIVNEKNLYCRLYFSKMDRKVAQTCLVGEICTNNQVSATEGGPFVIPFKVNLPVAIWSMWIHI